MTVVSKPLGISRPPRGGEFIEARTRQAWRSPPGCLALLAGASSSRRVRRRPRTVSARRLALLAGASSSRRQNVDLVGAGVIVSPSSRGRVHRGTWKKPGTGLGKCKSRPPRGGEFIEARRSGRFARPRSWVSPSSRGRVHRGSWKDWQRIGFTVSPSSRGRVHRGVSKLV